MAHDFGQVIRLNRPTRGNDWRAFSRTVTAQLHYLPEAVGCTVNADKVPWCPHISFGILSDEMLENKDITRWKKDEQTECLLCCPLLRKGVSYGWPLLGMSTTLMLPELLPCYYFQTSRVPSLAPDTNSDWNKNWLQLLEWKWNKAVGWIFSGYELAYACW